MPTANDCPHCAARDAVRLENGEYFCPWCLHAWTMSGDLILDRQPANEDGFLEQLAKAFDPD